MLKSILYKSIMCVVGVWRHMPPNADHAHDKYL